MNRPMKGGADEGNGAEKVISTVLFRALAVDPLVLTVDEMAREIGETRSSVEEAAADLAQHQLLQPVKLDEGSIEPTRAAVFYNELLAA